MERWSKRAPGRPLEVAWRNSKSCRIQNKMQCLIMDQNTKLVVLNLPEPRSIKCKYLIVKLNNKGANHILKQCSIMTHGDF